MEYRKAAKLVRSRNRHRLFHAETQMPSLSGHIAHLFICLFTCLCLSVYMALHCLTSCFTRWHLKMYKRWCFLDLHSPSMVSLQHSVGALVNLLAHTNIVASETLGESSS